MSFILRDRGLKEYNMIRAINISKSSTVPDNRKYLAPLAKGRLRELAHRMRREKKEKDEETFIHLTDLTALSGNSFHLDTHNRKALLTIKHPPMEIELSTHRGSIARVKRSWLSYILFKNPIKVANDAVDYFFENYGTISVGKTFTERKLTESEKF